MDGKGLIIVPDKDDNEVQRRALLLHCAGPNVQDIFYVLVNTGSAKDYQKGEDALIRHFVTQINTPYERHVFREIVQGEDETIDRFAVRKAQRLAVWLWRSYGGSDQGSNNIEVSFQWMTAQASEKRLNPHTSNLT